MINLRVFHKHASQVGQLVIAALLIGTALCCQVNAQLLTFTTRVKMSDNDANQGSPTLIYRSGTAYMYYVNHSNGQIYADVNFSQVPTAILVNGANATVNTALLTDVGATVFNGNILLSYIPSGSTSVAIASSTNGTTFGAPAHPTNANLGLPSASTFDYAFVPALAAAGDIVYAASVGTNSSGTNLVLHIVEFKRHELCTLTERRRNTRIQ